MRCIMHASYMCHDLSSRVAWLIHVWVMTHSCVRHDSIICAMTHSYAWHYPVLAGTHFAWHASFMYVPWLVHMCAMTRAYVCRHLKSSFKTDRYNCRHISKHRYTSKHRLQWFKANSKSPKHNVCHPTLPNRMSHGSWECALQQGVLFCSCLQEGVFVCKSVMPHISESCHVWMSHGRYDVTYEWDVSVNTSEISVGDRNESRHMWVSHGTYKWVTSHMDESCHVWMSHVTCE